MTDGAGEVRDGDHLDEPVLERHLRGVLELADAPMQVRQFAGGRANLTYLITFGDQELVLRRPPRGTLAPGAHDMAREHRVLSLLSPVYPRAPRALHLCEDPDVLGAPFVVLERRNGVVVRDAIASSMAHQPDVTRRVDLALLDAAADLHRIDVHANGLDALGRTEGFGQRQVDGWLARWQQAARGDTSARMDDLGHRLRDLLPPQLRLSVVHNDLKLDNCQFQPSDPDTVTSVFDWDMGTIGDPLFDIGSLLVAMRAAPNVWVLSVDDAVERYAGRSGIDVTHIDWYLAFGTWRTAVVLQQLYNRYLDGHSTDQRYASYGASIHDYVDRTTSLLESR